MAVVLLLATPAGPVTGAARSAHALVVLILVAWRHTIHRWVTPGWLDGARLVSWLP
jgi:hypothetical protein